MSENLPISHPKLKVTKRKLPHWQLDGSVYHVTFATKERLELSEPARQVVLDACLFFHLKRYEIFVMVIMPDHAHLLIQPWQKSGNNGNDRQNACSTKYWSLSNITHSIKSYTAKQIPKVMKHIGTVWEAESFDRIIRNEQEFEQTWEYIRQNAVKAKLCQTPESYPFFWQSNK